MCRTRDSAPHVGQVKKPTEPGRGPSLNEMRNGLNQECPPMRKQRADQQLSQQRLRGHNLLTARHEQTQSTQGREAQPRGVRATSVGPRISARLLRHAWGIDCPPPIARQGVAEPGEPRKPRPNKGPAVRSGGCERRPQAARIEDGLHPRVGEMGHAEQPQQLRKEPFLGFTFFCGKTDFVHPP